ncbi:MAG: hypothetical protein ABFE16_15150 [Armatimonadia bacterium]
MQNSLMLVVLGVCLSVAAAEPIRVTDFSGGSPGLPIADALGDLGDRVQRVAADKVSQLPAGGVLVVDGASDLGKLQAEGHSVADFVAQGGGLLIAGLPNSLPRTSGLWQALGAAAPADITGAGLFPDDSGYWMWIGQQKDESPDHIRYIRKSFEIKKPVKRAFVRCTVDNLYWVYLNGEQIGYSWSWFDNELWDLSKGLRPGRNVLAFKGRNVDGPGGFFAQIGIEYTDGTRELLVSDQSWKFHIPEEPNWAAVDYDDTAWRRATDLQPMVQYTHIYDKGIAIEGPLALHPPHPILNAITSRFGTTHSVRGVIPRPGATVLASAGDQPVVVCAEYGKGRVVLIDTLPQGAGMVSSDLTDDLLSAAILWLGHQTEGVRVAEAEYLPVSVARGAGVRLGYSLTGITPSVDGLLTATLTHKGKATTLGRYELKAGQPITAAWTGEQMRDPSADGAWQLDLTAKDTQGNTVFHRDVICQVTNALSIPANRHVVAQGTTVQFRGDLKDKVPQGARLTTSVLDPWGRSLPAPEPSISEGTYTWTYQVPDLAEGDYQLVVTIAEGAEVLDSFGVPFTVVPRIDHADFYPTTMRLSEERTLNRAAIESEIDDILAHGFNTLTFSGHRLGAGPGSPYDYAEDYAQRKGMAISYSFQGDFCPLRRDGLPPVSVFSPEEYTEALRPKIEAAVATCRQVPRLLNVQGYMDEPFQVSGTTFDDRPAAKEEFRRRYGIDMPTRDQAREDPALWLKYVDFWSDCYAAGWRQSYALVKKLYPDFWVELTHDSHCTFGAAGRNFNGFWAVDDVCHWGAPFDSVNYDIYPYLSTDFRTGKFGENRLPRISGMHMAFAEMRNLAYSYDKKLGFWVESGWSSKLAPESPLREATWSPRELTYTSIAAGCDYLNTFWGIPQDPRWWETYRGTMNEVKSIAPLLTRSRVPQARAAFLFPRTQHVLLQEEYWNVMVALEAFRQAYGELDCLHEEQLSQGKLGNYKVLVLFDTHLLKRKDAEILRDWVKAGGCLVADEVPSLDENKQPLGVLEPIFGVKGTSQVVEGATPIQGSAASLWGRRSYEAAGAKVAAISGEFPLVLENSADQGWATLLNFPVKDCYLEALVHPGDGSTAAAILGMLRRGALSTGQQAKVTSSNPGIEAALRQTPQGTTLLLLVNHESKDATTQVTLPHLAAGGVVRDLVSGQRVQAGSDYAMTLQCPWGETRVLGIFPSDPAGLTLAGLRPSFAPGQTVDYQFTVGGRNVHGNYLLQVSVTGPDGREYQAFSALTCTEDATCRRSLKLPVNAQPGVWTVHARSLWDDSEAKGSFTVSG